MTAPILPVYRFGPAELGAGFNNVVRDHHLNQKTNPLKDFQSHGRIFPTLPTNKNDSDFTLFYDYILQNEPNPNYTPSKTVYSEPRPSQIDALLHKDTSPSFLEHERYIPQKIEGPEKPPAPSITTLYPENLEAPLPPTSIPPAFKEFPTPEIAPNEKLLEKINLFENETRVDPYNEYEVDWVHWSIKKFPLHNEPNVMFDEHLLWLHINEATKLLAIYGGLPHFYAKKMKQIDQSFNHLTLLEALIYWELLHSSQQPTAFQAEFSIKNYKRIQQNHVTTVFTLLSAKQPWKQWEIDYDLSSNHATIYEKGIQTGHVAYVFRNHKLEEIEGKYKNQSLVLDPVWNSTKKHILREEHIKLGDQTLDLTYYKNTKETVWEQNVSRKNFKSKDTCVYKKKDNIFIVNKHVNILQYEGFITLIFLDGLPMPVSGQFLFKRS